MLPFYTAAEWITAKMQRKRLLTF